jgi:hypothetical protein
MGLLDDAIREHLDLKRARGADPAEVERLEREALGPVRRDPTIGAAHYEAPEHHDERLRPPEDLGYHDSTAPHSESHVEQRAPRLDLQPDGVHTVKDEEQPKRRFLRRARPVSLTEPAEQTPGAEHPGAFEHHEPLSDDDLLDHYQPLAHDDMLDHHEPLEHHEPLAHDDLLEHEHAIEQHEVTEPPHLQFDAPPARPRFTAEPPAVTDPETAAPAEAEPPAPAEPESEHHGEPAIRHHEPQPTHEFDVPSTFHKEDVEVDGEAEKGEVDEDDLLEETPEFLQDTPEHDRLWFEQHPPRDFDFDG